MWLINVPWFPYTLSCGIWCSNPDLPDSVESLFTSSGASMLIIKECYLILSGCFHKWSFHHFHICCSFLHSLTRQLLGLLVTFSSLLSWVPRKFTNKSLFLDFTRTWTIHSPGRLTFLALFGLKSMFSFSSSLSIAEISSPEFKRFCNGWVERKDGVEEC